MMRIKLLRVLLGMCVLLSGVFPAIAQGAVHAAAGAVYYVDSSGGDDGNAGTSEASAWKTLDKVNGTVFQPGDAILFKSGGVWTGTLAPQGSGAEGSPITIDKYGDGSKPLIAGGGAAAAVHFFNQEQWEVKNLEITNDAATPGVRRGIHVDGFDNAQWSNPTVYKHFLFENLDIHNVKGSVSDDYVHNGGIIVWGTNWDYHVSDVVVKDCTIHTVDSVGVYLYGAQKQYSSGFRVAGNAIYDIAADGAIILDTTGSIIENNVVHETHVRASGYHVPLWVYSSKDAIIQNNEVYNTAPGGDAMAYDADYRSDGTIIQYNYSHNNAGGAFLVVNNGTDAGNANTNTTIRYNISQNDGKAVFNFSGTPDTTYVYNNTVYLSPSSTTKVVDHTDWGGFAKNTYFYNNIIYNLGSGGYNFAGSTNNVFEHNLFYGTHPAGEPEDAYKMTADPLLASPGSGSYGRNSLAGYQLLSTSPAIGAGKTIAGNGGRDYFGNPVSDATAPNIGAYGGAGLDPDNLPPLPQPPEEVNLLNNSGFETGDFTYWSNHYNDIAVVNDNAHSGEYAVKLSGNYAGAEQVVSSLYPNTAYKLYAYGKAAGGGDAVIGVKSYGGSELGVHVSSSSYSRKDITFTTGDDATSATVFLYKAGGSGDVYFDDLVLVQYGPAPEGSDGSDPDYTVGTNDEFDDSVLDGQWRWVRENSANWSLTANPGSLQITSEPGDIVDGASSAKNLLLTGAPEGDWTIETKMDGKPSSQWSQGGLLVYVDDYSWLRLSRLYGDGNQIQFTKQVNAVREHQEIADPVESTLLYLRIVKEGSAYSAYYSADGVAYTQIWTAQTADFDDIKIGLTAVAGSGLVADFDYFHVLADDGTPEPEPGANLLPDPGFESGTCTGNWGCWGGAGIVDSNARTGQYAAKVETRYSGISRGVTGLTPGTTYRFTAWGKGAGGSARLEVQKPTGSPIRTTHISSAEYTRWETTFTTGPEDTAVKIEMYKDAEGGAVYFDDFELVAVSDTPQQPEEPEEPQTATATLASNSETLRAGQSFELTAGAVGLASGMEDGFAALDVVVRYDPAVLEFALTGEAGQEALDGSAVEPLRSDFSLLGSAVKPDAGQLRLILSSSSAANTIAGDGPLFKLLGKVKSGAAIGATSVQLAQADTSLDGVAASLDISTASLGLEITAADMNRAALDAAIAMAQAVFAGTVEGDKIGEYAIGAKAALQAAVAAADVAGNSQEEVDQATAALQAAIAQYLTQYQTLVAGAAKITIADLSIMAGYLGTTSASATWSEIEKADVLRTNRIDIHTLEAVTQLILDDWRHN